MRDAVDVRASTQRPRVLALSVDGDRVFVIVSSSGCRRVGRIWSYHERLGAAGTPRARFLRRHFSVVISPSSFLRRHFSVVAVLRRRRRSSDTRTRYRSANGGWMQYALLIYGRQ